MHYWSRDVNTESLKGHGDGKNNTTDNQLQNQQIWIIMHGNFYERIWCIITCIMNILYTALHIKAVSKVLPKYFCVSLRNFTFVCKTFCILLTESLCSPEKRCLLTILFAFTCKQAELESFARTQSFSGKRKNILFHFYFHSGLCVIMVFIANSLIVVVHLID